MNIRPVEMRFLDELFEMESGYVLDFKNRTFDEFFQSEVGLDIYDPAYELNGTSKAKRLRTFLQVGQKAAVHKALRALWEYREAIRRRSGTEESLPTARDELSAIVERLGGSPLPANKSPPTTRPSAPDAAVAGRLAEEFLRLGDVRFVHVGR